MSICNHGMSGLECVVCGPTAGAVASSEGCTCPRQLDLACNVHGATPVNLAASPGAERETELLRTWVERIDALLAEQDEINERRDVRCAFCKADCGQHFRGCRLAGWRDDIRLFSRPRSRE